MRANTSVASVIIAIKLKSGSMIPKGKIDARIEKTTLPNTPMTRTNPAPMTNMNASKRFLMKFKKPLCVLMGTCQMVLSEYSRLVNNPEAE